MAANIEILTPESNVTDVYEAMLPVGDSNADRMVRDEWGRVRGEQRKMIPFMENVNELKRKLQHNNLQLETSNCNERPLGRASKGRCCPARPGPARPTHSREPNNPKPRSRARARARQNRALSSRITRFGRDGLRRLGWSQSILCSEAPREKHTNEEKKKINEELLRIGKKRTFGRHCLIPHTQTVAKSTFWGDEIWKLLWTFIL